MGNLIGRKMKYALCLMGAAAMAGASIAPAAARDHYRYPGYGYGGSWYGSPYRYRHHRDRGLGAGDVIGIAALIGAVAIIASSANKDRKARSAPDRRYDDRDYDENQRGDYRGSASEDEAVNMCASAARNKAESQSGGYAEIVDVDRPRAVGSDGWSVDGRLEQRSGYRGEDRETRRFSCDVRGGRVAEVYISRDVI